MKLSSPSSSAPKSSNDLYLIATHKDININELESKTIQFLSGISAKNTIPLFAKIIRNNGIISDAKCGIYLNKEKIKDVSVQICQIGSTNKQVIANFDQEIAYHTEGDYNFVIDNINGSAASISVEIYGLKV
jgi:hypothetical protein